MWEGANHVCRARFLLVLRFCLACAFVHLHASYHTFAHFRTPSQTFADLCRRLQIFSYLHKLAHAVPNSDPNRLQDTEVQRAPRSLDAPLCHATDDKAAVALQNVTYETSERPGYSTSVQASFARTPGLAFFTPHCEVYAIGCC